MRKMSIFMGFLTVLCLIAWIPVLEAKVNDKRLVAYAYEDIQYGDWASAEIKLKEALEINPNNAYALLNLGVVYENTGKPEEAKKMYEKVIQLKPVTWPVRVTNKKLKGMSLVNIAKRNLRCLSGDECFAGSAAPPAQDKLLNESGYQKILKMDYDGAEKDLKAALELNPVNPYSILNLGVVYEAKGQYVEAKEMYQRVIAMSPGEVPPHVSKKDARDLTLKQIAAKNLKQVSSTERDIAVSYNSSDNL